MAEEERAKRHTIKIGFQKIQINRKWEYLNREKTKKLPDKQATSTRNPKKKDNINDRTYIATLNVRTLGTPERETKLENALEGIKFNVLGLCELRKEGGNIIKRANGNILYYYGKAGHKGVGFLVNKDYKHNIGELSGISERIAVLKLKIVKINISIIQVYTPTQASSEEELEAFYDYLDKALTDYRARRTYIIGDFNHKVGIRQYEERPLGPYGMGVRNSRGERLVQFAEEHNLYILNSFYKKGPSSKWTWQSLDRKTRNEIDFILSNSKEDFLDVQVCNGLKFDTDHRLVRATLNLKRRRRRRVVQQCKPKADKIDKDGYKDALKQETHKLQESTEMRVQELYNNIKTCVMHSVKQATQKKATGVRNSQKVSKSTIKLIELKE
jgi:hypothetical protein